MPNEKIACFFSLACQMTDLFEVYYVYISMHCIYLYHVTHLFHLISVFPEKGCFSIVPVFFQVRL